MSKPPPPGHSPDALPEQAAARLLTRASELDAARASDVAVADLREAATEAGISVHAFDSALTEVHGAGKMRLSDVDRPSWRAGRGWILGAAAAAALTVGAIATSWQRTFTGADALSSVPVVEEAMVFRCLTGSEAAELVRPLLQDRASTMRVAPAAPRVLTVRTTPAKMQRVKALLSEHERTGTGACMAPEPFAPTQ
jgi:predicted DNA-binding protein (UPF0251 family)